ncbi:hypothetical protein COX03_03470 [Candidatus Woesebacteria bacterium CG22_combo_CG10-13_8_21_14_all_39_10]|uniref:Uncharacterized protein n=1 Tax=Candidatus Woesebacteria bacterium CG22_combo_CG10-13_8_21_14_all_39_10 TaxID=1975059 RepID=A0A2H0BI79_9BACT|nr:MAG: hypothetical protein COX03_03470 [Candidatus Woesebacteria bacterium CG22_combo_CG10-13_8_21_14_all_39_10]
MVKMKTIKTKYATESFVWGLINKLEENIDNKFDKADAKAEKRHSEVMNHLDGLAKGFKKFDEEQVILSAHSKDHTDRIEKLENTVYATS